MTRTCKVLLTPGIAIIVGLCLMLPVNLRAEEEKEKPEYVGVGKCKICHSKLILGGVEYHKWEKLAHAKAYESLSTEESLQGAKTVGVTDPENDEKCLKCHITTLKFETEKMRKEGVGCERCHGPGSLYKSKSVMEDYDLAVKKGMTDFRLESREKELEKIEKLCRECHGLEHKDENPFAQEFVFEEFYCKIKHDEETLRKEMPELFE